MLGEFLVGEVSLPVQRWAVGLDEGRQPVVGFLQGLHGGVYRLALMRKKLVHVHCLQFGLSGEYKMCWLAQGKVFGFALGEFGFTLYRFDSGDKRNDGFDLFGAVIELATYLGMTQETAVTKFL